MADALTDVFVGAYNDLDAATREFEALSQLAADGEVEIEAAILITHAGDGTVSVRQTADHRGRRGVEWGGAVGVLVGLAAPPLLATTAAGAAAGGLVGKFVDKRLETEMHDKIGENLPAGSAGIIALFDDEQRLAVERALPNALAKSIVQTDKKGVRALKDGLAEAMGKFVPDRTVLPIPDKRFGGAAGRTLEDSVGDWTVVADVRPPQDAPNVLVILIDDAGFGQPDTFGGPIPTPNFTRVGEAGLEYNRFHVTALCSPTRAALLTGRNMHHVGMGSITEFPGPYPGYTGTVPRTCASIPKILAENGYATGGFGKWHLTPDREQGPAGPFTHWPQGWGFQRFYGFLSGAAGQWDTLVTQDNATIGVPEGKDGGQYYFPEDMTDKAIEWLHGVRGHDADKPWFMYYSTGCAHAPHHVAKEWADKFKGQFDQGWDTLREEVFERQKQLGVVPQDAVLTERPDIFPAWDSLDEDAKKLYARQMEVYAGYQANADFHVGRLLDAVEAMGDMDNTLVFYIWGDNGASMEGTTTGSFNEMTFLNGIVLDPAKQLELIEQYGGIEELGGPHTAPHCAAAWAWAGNTPFQFGKQVASHLGGTRNPMVVAWPNRVKARREIRSQFTHVIDVGPTILEAAGIPAPTSVDGIAQDAMDGTSFLDTFDDANAVERHTVQYFEFAGSRAIYKDGWWACAKLDRLPWDLSPETLKRWGPGSGWDPDQDPWELYYLPDDFSQADDLAEQNPEKLEELRRLFWEEAERNQVLPLFGCVAVFMGDLPPVPTQTRHTYAGDVQNINRGLVPRVYGRSYAIEAELVVPESGAEGVLVANADFIGGWGLWIDQSGRLNHTYSWLGVETYRQTSTTPIPTGEVTVKMLFETDEPKPGSGGTVTLWANGEQIGEGRLDHTIPIAPTSYAGMDIGRDNGLVVDLDYEDKAPYAFTGRLKQVIFDLEPAGTADQEQALHEHASIHAVAHGVSA
ncbi:MAG TPA: arylsulfatase [Solirubrobacteraceae bacterium]|nr:arylsulfatase [Solirubrobacteraceae bacterium]